MKYLYIIDIAGQDGDLSDSNPAITQYARRVFLLTNAERSETFAGTGDYWFSYIARPDAASVAPGVLDRFEPVPGISHSGVSLNGENNSGNLSLTLPAEHAVAQLFTYDTPAALLRLTVLVQGAQNQSPVVLWAGQIDSCAFDAELATFECSHISAVLRRQGLTRKHPRTCGHTLYSPAPACGVKHSLGAGNGYFLRREDGFLAEVRDGGMTLIVPEAANRAAGFFAEGFITIAAEYAATTSGGLTQHRPRALFPISSDADKQFAGGYRRHIVSHSGSELKLSAPMLAPLVSPVRVSVFAGCNLTKETCIAKFGNYVNFGGYPYIPIKNAFESGVKD